MPVIQVTFDLPTLQQTLRAKPGMVLALEDVRTVRGQIHFVVRISRDDGVDFDREARNDPTARSVTRLVDVGGDELYCVEFADAGALLYIYESIVELNGIILRGSGTNRGWSLRVFFPDWPSLSTFHQRCRQAEIGPQVRSLTAHENELGSGNYGLTELQHETLVRAIETGYFEIPKGTTLVELGDEFGVSDQAVSERLRRAIHTLVHNTIRIAGGKRRGNVPAGPEP